MTFPPSFSNSVSTSPCMTPEELASGNLAAYNTIVLGIRAYDTREDVRKNNQRLLDYVSNGGTLIVQYNQQYQEFNSGHYTPLSRRREPRSRHHRRSSGRDPRAQRPNLSLLRIKSRRKISMAGCRNVASTSWLPGIPSSSLCSPRTIPVKPRSKADCCARRYGKGVYIYSAYAFFRQLPAGVPGAIRLFVNLLDAGHEPATSKPQSHGWGRKRQLMPNPHPIAPASRQSNSAQPDGLVRGISLGSATALNMIDMIGVGPFITIPLIISAMGGPQAMLGWILGAFFAICDGLVWAELGASFPGSGGSYGYLKEIYGPNRWGRYLSFLFVWQLSFSAPLSIASGCIGLSRYASYLWHPLEHTNFARTFRSPIGSLEISLLVTPATFLAIATCLFCVFLLYRRIQVIGQLSKLLWIGVLGTIAWVIFSGSHPFQCMRAPLTSRRMHFR